MVDLNRAGVGLIEIVSAPEIESPAEASLFVSNIHELLQDLQICSGLMEQGVMRVDVNVNWVDSETNTAITPRVELKNVNGLNILEEAVSCELERQRTEPLESQTQQTRLFIPGTRVTKLLRLKDNSIKYRYLPEYDVSEHPITPEIIKAITQSMPKTRHQRIQELTNRHPALKTESLLRLWSHSQLPDLFEASLNSCSAPPEFILNWMIGDFMGVLNKTECHEISITADSISTCLDLLHSNRLDRPSVKRALFQALQSHSDLVLPKATQTDSGDLLKDIDELLSQNSDRVAFLRSQEGQKKGSLDFFIGRLLKLHRNTISIPELTQLLRAKIYQ